LVLHLGAEVEDLSCSGLSGNRQCNYFGVELGYFFLQLGLSLRLFLPILTHPSLFESRQFMALVRQCLVDRGYGARQVTD
jgi:hypothetical protein